MSGDYAQVFRAMSSEATLALVALGVLTFDLLAARKRELAVRRQLVGAVALMGLALAAARFGIAARRRRCWGRRWCARCCRTAVSKFWISKVRFK